MQLIALIDLAVVAACGAVGLALAASARERHAVRLVPVRIRRNPR